MRFDSYHPVINLIYFTAAIICTVKFNHPVFLAISYLAAFVYSIKLNGKRSAIFNAQYIVTPVYPKFGRHVNILYKACRIFLF